MNMKELRERAKLTTVDVAYHLDVAESSVRNWDVGRTLPTFPINEVPKVLKLYQCSLDEITEAIEVSRSEFLAKQKDKEVKS